MIREQLAWTCWSVVKISGKLGGSACADSCDGGTEGGGAVAGCGRGECARGADGSVGGGSAFVDSGCGCGTVV
eukprot:6491546-Amphidinium_carterae.2